MTYYGGTELADSFRTVRKNTLVIAEEIPEAQFDFRTTDEVRSVAELLSHIAISASRNYEMHAVNRVTTFEGFDWSTFLEKWKQKERAPCQNHQKSTVADPYRTGSNHGRKYDPQP